MGTTPPLLPIYYSQLPSPRYAFAFRLRVSPIYGFERERTKVCYEFVVVGGRVRNYQASKLGLACQLPPLPLHPPYLPFVQEGSPLPSVFSNSIRRKKREEGGKGGKQKRRNREYLHSPTPFPLPIISLLWTRDEKLERLKKKQARKQASKQASMPRALLPFDLLPTSKVDWRYTRKNCTDERKLIFRVSSGAGHHLLASISSPCLSTRSLRHHHHHHHESVVASRYG